LERSLANERSNDRAFLPIAYRVRLSVTDNCRAEGLQLLNDYADKQLAAAASDGDRAKLFLQAGNLCSIVAEHQAAERWYRRLMEIAPNSYVLVARSLLQQNRASDAVDVCLQATKGKTTAEVATVLAQILAEGDANRELDRRVRPIIDSALTSDGGNVNLLMSVAVQRIAQDDNDEAIRLFRRVVEIEPNHVLALNNLATMLADRPDQLNEARKYVERALAVAPRSPALLDTLGTILVRSQQYERAVAVLEEAVAGATSDPRYYFHLAAAYEKSGRESEAQKALATALRQGLDKSILTSGDRELLASLKHELLTASYSE
jgi:tetratricopeptide (TPR) repeat protein